MATKKKQDNLNESMDNMPEEKLAEIGRKVREGGIKGTHRTQELVRLGHEKEEEEEG